MPVTAAAQPLKAPTSEVGYAQSASSWWMSVDQETTPELMWPRSLEVYDAMVRQDAQTASVLRAVQLPIRSTAWRVKPNGAHPRVVALVAADLGLPIAGSGDDEPPAGRRRDRFSWQKHLQQALLELRYGHMFFEQVYRIDENGFARLRKLGPRMPRTLAEIKSATDGGLVSIVQNAPGLGVRNVEIPVSRLVGYVHEQEGGSWLGNSLLRPAYKHWLIKDRLLRVQAQTIERNGMGVPLYTGAEAETDLTHGSELAQAWRSGENAGAAVPHDAKLELKGVEGDLPDANTAIRYHDEQIARAVLAHFLNLGTQTGSWALGTTFADFFVLSLQSVAEQIADVATQHIVEDLVDLNFGTDEPAPEIVFDPIGSRRDATAEAIKVLVDAGVLTADEDIEDFVRTAYRLPGRSADQTPVKESA